jgi:hypothetical protein
MGLSRPVGLSHRSQRRKSDKGPEADLQQMFSWPNLSNGFDDRLLAKGGQNARTEMDCVYGRIPNPYLAHVHSAVRMQLLPVMNRLKGESR